MAGTLFSINVGQKPHNITVDTGSAVTTADIEVVVDRGTTGVQLEDGSSERAPNVREVVAGLQAIIAYILKNGLD